MNQFLSHHLKSKAAILLLVFGLNLVFFEGLARVIMVFNPEPSSYHADFDLKKHLIDENPDTENDILFLGDSLTERSVYTEYLKMDLQRHGVKSNVLNLATPGATPQIMLEMLKYRVEKKAKAPKLVVLGVTFRWFHRYWQDEKVQGENPNEKMADSYFGQCIMGHPQSLSEGLLCGARKDFYMLRYPALLSNFFHQLASYLISPSKKSRSLQEDKSSLFFKHGWVPRRDEYKTETEFKKYLAKRTTEFLQYDSYFVDADKQGWYTELYVDRISQLCKQNKISLVLVLPPTTKTFNTVFYNEALKLPKTKFIALLKKYAMRNGVQFWDFSERITSAENNYFNDIVHLNVIGSLAYTKLLAVKIRSPKN
jgi:hypothetical protein